MFMYGNFFFMIIFLVIFLLGFGILLDFFKDDLSGFYMVVSCMNNILAADLSGN